MATLVIIKNSKISGDNPTKLAPGELAINIADGKLYYGDVNSTVHQLTSGGGGGVTQITAGSNITISPVGGTGNVTINATGGGGSTPPGGSNTQIQYNNAGAFGGVPTLTWNGTTLSATGSFTGSFTGSLFGTASFAVSSSYALTSSNIQGGTANYIPLWNTATSLSSSILYQTSSRVGIGTTSPQAILDISGDIVVNRLTVGKGGNNNEYNTALGVDALMFNEGEGSQNVAVGYNSLKANTQGISNTAVGSNTLESNLTGRYNTALGQYALQNSSEDYNVAIGYGAARYLAGRGNNTIIGGNNNMKPDAITQFTEENTLSISQGGAGDYGSGLPHIWAPKRVKINVGEKINIIELNPTYYAGIAADWVTDDGNGNQEVGNIIGTWDSTLSNLIVKYPNRYYIGSPSNDFTEGEEGGNMAVAIKNTGPNDLYVQITCRLLYRPFI